MVPPVIQVAGETRRTGVSWRPARRALFLSFSDYFFLTYDLFEKTKVLSSY